MSEIEQIREFIARELGPLNERLIVLNHEINKLTIFLSTMHAHLEKRGVIEKEEFEAELARAATEAKAAYDAAVKAMRERSHP